MGLRGIYIVCTFVHHLKQSNMTTVKTFAQLTLGTVINYRNNITGADTDFVILDKYEDRFGSWVSVLNLSTFEKDLFMQHTQIKDQWSVVKEN